MKIWSAAVAALMLSAGAASAADAPNCALKQFDSLPLEVYPDHLLLPVSFGATPEKLVFRMEDAGSGLNSDVARAMDLYVTSVPPNVTVRRDGEDITRIAHVKDFHIGHQTIQEMQFLMVRPGRYGNGVVGDFGTRLFEQVDFELDLAAGKLNLFSSDRCPGKAVYWTKTGFAQLPLKKSGAKETGFIRAEVMLDGKPLTVAFSTQGRSRIGMNAMRRIFNVDQTSPDLVAVNEDLLGHKLYRYPFKELTADGLTVTHPDIVVFDEEPRPECNDRLHIKDPTPEESVHSTVQPRLARCFGGDDAVIGLSVLKKLHIFVSAKEGMLYLTGADAK